MFFIVTWKRTIVTGLLAEQLPPDYYSLYSLINGDVVVTVYKLWKKSRHAWFYS